MKDKSVGSVLKTETKVIGIVVICLVITVIGISYALFFDVKGNEKNQIVKAGTLEFSYANGSQITNTTNSDCFIPMSKEEALTHSECEYKIGITNTGTLPGNYNISLNSETVDKPIELSKLKVLLKKEGSLVEGYPKVGTETALVTNEKIEAGSVVNYTVQVYVDVENETLTADDDEKNISLKINGDAVVNGEELNPNNSVLAIDYITKMSKTDTTNLMADDTKEANIRYVGASPNNYIDIGDRDGEGNPILWRIIGVMNNITNLDNGEQQESLVKIIRADSIGDYSWDSSAEGINIGFGVNEWSKADLMKLLNPQEVYSSTSAIGESLYWNRGSGSCYNTSNDRNTPCDFTNSGLSEEAKKKIAKVRWNTGTSEEVFDDKTKMTAKYIYEKERSSHHGKEMCTSAPTCNDEVPRTTIWDGYIGLIYPSDYAYALGNSERNNCLIKSMYEWSNENCGNNNWLIPSTGNLLTITPLASSSLSSLIITIYSSGTITNSSCNTANVVIPVAYLKSNTKILFNYKSGQVYGTEENPFVAI